MSDQRSEEYRCLLGREYFHSTQSRRLLTADVRVGDYDLDNHPLVPYSGQIVQELPEDGDEFSIRHETWQELDARYKSAAADFLRKQALRVRRGKTEYDTDDMTKESAVIRDVIGSAPASKMSVAVSSSERMEKLCLEISAVFRKNPSLIASRVSISDDFALRRFFDSKGSRVRYDQRAIQLQLGAQAMTTDGMKISGASSFLVRSLDDLPKASELVRSAEEMLADIDDLHAIKSTSPFSAPAIIDPSVGSAILQSFATRISGEQQRNPEGAQTFRGKLGKNVLPKFLSLVDDPTQEKFKGRRLMGYYAVDEQGVPSQRVTLVDRGVLRGYLLSRYPVIGFSRSNGHGRAAPGRVPMGRAGNIFLKSSVVYSQSRLIELLREECLRQNKPYGIWIAKARSWRQQDTTDQQQAFRLMPTLVYLVEAKTGKKELVRDLDMVGTPLNLLEKISAVGDNPEVVNSMVDDASGPLPVSSVVPTLLLREVELQRAETKPERPPVLPAPSEP